MYLITKITPTKKTGSNNIYLNNIYSFTILDLVLATFKIKVGSYLDASLLEQIITLELTERFKNFALTSLQSRPKSKKEIEIKLNQRAKKYKESWPIFGGKDINLQFLIDKENLNAKKHPDLDSFLSTSTNILSSRRLEFLMDEKVVNNIFTRAKENALGFLEKYNYINDIDFAKWVVEQRLKQGKSKLYIKQDLFKKGVLPQVITTVLSSIDSKSSINLVYKKALKKYAKEIDKNKQKQKIYRYLLSKGFSYDEINLNCNNTNYGI